MHKIKLAIMMLSLIITLALCSCKNNNEISFDTESTVSTSYATTQPSIKENDINSLSVTTQTSFKETEIKSSSVAVKASEEESFMNMLKKEIHMNELLFWSYDDYNLNGENEAFAVTGKNTYGGTLWYINSDGIAKLNEDIGCDTIFTFTVSDDTKHLCLSTINFANYSLIWSVNEKNAVEEPISNVGQMFTILNNHNFTITQSAFDNMLMGTSLVGGHTWKPYYFYYDNGFYEYGGTEISVDELLQYENADESLELIANKNGTITSIIRRSNNIININYSVPEPGLEATQHLDWYYNITLKIVDNKVFFVENDNGVYLPALVPDIAVYT